jgi:hypothetical protein
VSGIWADRVDSGAEAASDPLAPPAREWPGVLEAEWVDRGLSQESEDWLHVLLPLSLAVLAVPFLLLAASSPKNLLQMGAVFLWCCFGLLAPSAWLSLRHRPRKVVMRLDPGVCRVFAVTGKVREVFQLPRLDAGLLRILLSRDKRNEKAMLQLEDRAGQVRIELIDRRVRVTAVPFGLEFGQLGIDPKAAPLSTLIGTWWPDPTRRSTRMRPTWWRRRTEDRPWKQPDLDQYAVWKARQMARLGLILLGCGAFEAVALLLMFGTAYLGIRSAAHLFLQSLVVIPCSWGLFNLRRASTTSQQHGGPGLRSILGGILRRNG